MTREEAIEKVRQMSLPKETMEILEALVPELKESEDEIHRKWILEYLYDGLRKADEQFKGQFKSAIEWLEKQKEQNQKITVKIPKFRVGDIIQHVPLESWDSSRKINAIDEDGYYIDMSHLGDNVSGGFIGFSFEDEYELVEQKPAEWSKADEKTISDACCWIAEYAGYLMDKNYGKASMLMGLTDKLKSLRPQPQEEIYQAAKHDLAIKFMNYLDENRPEGKMSLSNGECEDIDKAFKENDWEKIIRYIEKYSSHWKPSEEQMKALSSAKDDCIGDTYEVLDSLYIDLKKL